MHKVTLDMTKTVYWNKRARDGKTLLDVFILIQTCVVNEWTSYLLIHLKAYFTFI